MKRQSNRDHGSKVSQLASGGDVAEDKKTIAKAIGQHEAHDHKGSKKTKLKLKSGGKVEGQAGKKRLDRPGRTRRDMGGPIPPGMPGAPPTGAPPMAGPGAAMGAQMTPQQLQMLIAQKQMQGAAGPGAGAMAPPMPQPQKRGGVTREAHAKGGKVGKGKKGGTTVNVIIAGGGDKGAGGPPGGPPPGLAMPPKPPMPPMPPPKPPGPPMGGPPPGMGGPGGPPPGPPPGMHAAGGRVGRMAGGSIKHGSQGGLGRLEKIKAYGANSTKETNTPKPEDMENKNNTESFENKTAR
jgi:hypothetical protein